MNGHSQGRSLARGRGLPPPQKAVPFFPRRGIGLRHRTSPPAPGERDGEEMSDPDAGGVGRVGTEAMAEEVALVTESWRSLPSNRNGSNGPNGSPNGSGESQSSEDDSSVGDGSESSSTLLDETANTQGIGRGIRPDNLDVVITRCTQERLLGTKQGLSIAQIIANINNNNN